MLISINATQTQLRLDVLLTGCCLMRIFISRLYHKQAIFQAPAARKRRTARYQLL